MSDPTNIDGNIPQDDNALSDLYKRASTEEPSPSVDQAVLSKARKQIEQPAKKQRYNPGWAQSLSVAAVFVLSVTVIFLVEKHQPLPLEEPLPTVAVDQAVEQARQSSSLSPATKQLPLAEKNQSMADVSEDDASLYELERKQTAVSESFSPSPAKSKSRKKTETMNLVTGTIETEATEEKLVRSLSKHGLPGDIKLDEAVADRSCYELTESECLNSAACTLSKNTSTSSYQCLPAKDHCELMFRQSDGTREGCESRQGCEFTPSNCYCPPGAKCICGNGEPAQCGMKKMKNN